MDQQMNKYNKNTSFSYFFVFLVSNFVYVFVILNIFLNILVSIGVAADCLIAKVDGTR